MKVFFVEGEVHTLLKNGSYRVKVKVLNPELALYINGMIVFPPSDKSSDWTVYTPKVANARIIEFAKTSILWQEIRDSCINAVKLDMSNQHMDRVVNMTQHDNQSPEDFNKELLEDIDKLFPSA